MMEKQSGGLHRALTWRYMLVTTFALLIIEIVVLLVLTRFAPPYTFGMQPDVEFMSDLGDMVAEYLRADDPDGLQDWLSELAHPVVNVTLDDNWLHLTLATFPQRDQQTVLVFREREGVLAVTPSDHPLASITRLEELPGPLDSDLLNNVPPQPGNNLVTTRSDNATLTVYPVQSGDGDLLALLIVLNFAPERSASLGEVVALIIGSTLILMGLTALLGGGFGYMVSHSVVHRLKKIVTTTAEWGQGNFSGQIHDASAQKDELTALAQHLNHLRVDIQEMLLLREALAVAETREDFARDLHDSVKQSVFTLRMTLATVEALLEQDLEQATAHLNRTISLAQSIQEDLSLMIDTFRNHSQAVAPLPERLQSLVADWSFHTGISATTDIDSQGRADLHITHAVNRITHEALSNAYRHSDATQAHVSLSLKGEKIMLSVTDNGQGFDIK
ncbi:MAG: histidine kinase, partial [Chloroflexota bacterium]